MACATAARMQNSPPAVFDHVWQVSWSSHIELLHSLARATNYLDLLGPKSPF